jgi:hypothetical protein
MGILDDAIREHLELKRRRGADPSEIDRLEREALGPVRRAPHDAPDALVEDEGPLPADYALEEDVPDWAEPPELPGWSGSRSEPMPADYAPEADRQGSPTEHWPAPGPEDEFEGESDWHEPPLGPEARSDLPRHHEIAEEWEAHERGSLGEPAGIEPDSPAPAPPPPASADPMFEGERQRPAPPADYEGETAEYELEADEETRSPRREPAEDEDVLEETPDFLQDTPDHDRLWFEQRPPRDFDFDG